MNEIRCLTLHAHWAAAIFQLGKDVENRTWPTSYRGPLAIHAGSKFDHAICRCIGLDIGTLRTGVILGTVQLIGVIRNSDSRWAEHGYYHWILADPKLLDQPLPYRGQQGLFRVSMDIAAHASPEAGPRVR
jgi:hypothetical protein